MAKIWLLKPGEIRRGEPVDDRSLDFCFSNLGLRQRDWVAQLETKDPIVGKTEDAERAPAFGHVLIEIDESDLTQAHPGWQIGYYMLRSMDATKAREVLKL